MKRRLIRIVIAAVLFAAYLVLELTHTFDKWTENLPEIWKILIPLVPAVVIYLIAGCDVLFRAARNIVRGKVFDENFLMVIATFGAFAIGEFAEAAAVMIFYQTGEWFQSYAVGKSRASIAELMKIAPEYANVERDGELVEVDPEDVEPGMIFLVKPGEKVPLDGVVLEGDSRLDTSSLTGESVPRSVHAGEEIVSGSVNLSGVLRVQATKCYEDSTVSRILELVENASGRKAPVENFITRFARYYTPAVTIAAVILAVVVPFLTDRNFPEWIRRACSFLVISCPCALVISVPLGFFGGIGAASKIGVLVKGSNYLEALSKVKTVAFDKTGTLTKGSFTVTGVHPASGVPEAELMTAAATAEKYSDHPVAKAILECAASLKTDNETADAEDGSGFAVEERSGRGVIAKRGMETILAGNAKLFAEEKIAIEPDDTPGTVVYLAKNGRYLGSVVISDSVKDGAAEALKTLKNASVRTVMLTGDRREAAEHIAAELGIDEVKAELLPADKISALETFMTEPTAFVGDGINDAPVLTRADVGLAMGALGSDAAIEAADIVLMDDDLRKIGKTVQISRKTLRIVYENIGFALGVKFVVLCLGALGLASMWLAMFADVGVAVIAILNAMRALKSPKQ